VAPAPSRTKAGPGDITDPQSLNRYAYALNNPTTLTDPLGLDSCTIANGCKDPHVVSHEPGLGSGGFGGSCYIDGLPAFCNAAYALLTAGSGGTTVSSVGGFLTFQVPIPPGAVQSTLMDPDTGLLIGSSPGAFYPGSFETVTTDIPGFDFPSGGFLYTVKDFLARVPSSGSFFVPLVPVLGPFAAMGANVTLSIVPRPLTVCGGLGVGAAVPATRGGSVGPLLHGATSDARSILSGWSFSSSVQPNPFAGYQAITNSSGTLGGPTVGTFGASISLTVSGCRGSDDEGLVFDARHSRIMPAVPV
jgi:hypothetical protein